MRQPFLQYFKESDLKIKICGLALQEDVIRCSSLGVDALGFLLNTDEDITSYDKLSLSRAQYLVELVPKHVASFLLIKDYCPSDIVAKVELINPDCVQLQNSDLELSDIQYLRARLNSRKLIKTFHLDSQTSSIFEEIDKMAGYVDAILLDSKKGGSGEVHDWNYSKLIYEYCFRRDIPVILAGGLSVENIPQALKIFRPYMLDIMSSVSVSRGVKNIGEIGKLMTLRDKF